MSKDEAVIEAEIQSKGLNAPRLTPEKIEATIVAEYFTTLDKAHDGAPLMLGMACFTICTLVLRNGHIVIGESRPVSDTNFDAELGRKIARENAKGKVWSLEGYALREHLYNSPPASSDA